MFISTSALREQWENSETTHNFSGWLADQIANGELFRCVECDEYLNDANDMDDAGVCNRCREDWIPPTTKVTFDTTTDAETYVLNSGVFGYDWCDKCSLDDYADFLYWGIVANVKGDFWANEQYNIGDYYLYAYLQSRGADLDAYNCNEPENYDDFAKQCL